MSLTQDPCARDVRVLAPGLVGLELAAGNGPGLAAGRYWVIDADAPADLEQWGDHAGCAGIAHTGAGDVVVAAPEGGLLSDLLDVRPGLSEGEVVTILLAVASAVALAPLTPERRTRLDASCIALSAEGEPLLLPGRARGTSVASPFARFGRLAYHAISGQRWEDAALPIPHAAAAAAPAFQEFLMDLFDAERDDTWAQDAEIAAHMEALAWMAEPDAIGLRPSASTAGPDAAPTGSLPRTSILAALLAEAHAPAGPSPGRPATPAPHSPAAEPSAQGPSSRRLASALSSPPLGAAARSDDAQQGPAPTGRAAHERSPEEADVAALRRSSRGASRMRASPEGRRPPRQAVGKPGQRERPAGPREGKRSVRSTRRRVVTSLGLAGALACAIWLLWPAQGGGPDPGGAVTDDPREALEQLTRERADVLVNGRPERLTSLTVPGSVAESAERELATRFPPGVLSEDLTFTLENVAVVSGDCNAQAGEGSTCSLSALSITSEHSETRGGATTVVPESRADLVFTLLRTAEGWRVESVR